MKHFHHRDVGDLELNYERLEVVFDTGLTIFTYTADPGTRSAEARAYLVARGIEVTKVQEYPWGRFCFFSDRDGNG